MRGNLILTPKVDRGFVIASKMLMRGQEFSILIQKLRPEPSLILFPHPR